MVRTPSICLFPSVCPISRIQRLRPHLLGVGLLRRMSSSTTSTRSCHRTLSSNRQERPALTHPLDGFLLDRISLYVTVILIPPSHVSFSARPQHSFSATSSDSVYSHPSSISSGILLPISTVYWLQEPHKQAALSKTATTPQISHPSSHQLSSRMIDSHFSSQLISHLHDLKVPSTSMTLYYITDGHCTLP